MLFRRKADRKAVEEKLREYLGMPDTFKLSDTAWESVRYEIEHRVLPAYFEILKEDLRKKPDTRRINGL